MRLPVFFLFRTLARKRRKMKIVFQKACRAEAMFMKAATVEGDATTMHDSLSGYITQPSSKRHGLA